MKNPYSPALRFPGFTEPWVEKTLGEVCEILNNKRRPISGTERVKGPYPYYGASGIVDYVSDYIFDEELLLVGEDGAKWGSFEKTAFIVNGRYWVNNHAHVLRPIQISIVLLEQYLVMLDLAPFVTGAAPPKLTLGKLKEIVFTLPPTLSEQQKIASCLSSLDEKIEAETARLEALKAHKKGLMQALFPAPGQSQPALRFPGFSGDWEEKTLGEVCDFINGRAYKQEELLESGKYRVLRVGNFFSSNSWYYSDLELDETKYCDSGDLLYAWSASFGPRIWIGEKIIYHYHIWKVEEKEGADKLFIYYLLDYVTETIKSKKSNGLGLMHITKGAIESWETFVPTLPEQQKIAACLSALDERISTQSDTLEALKTYKKGLMQGLFPTVS